MKNIVELSNKDLDAVVGGYNPYYAFVVLTAIAFGLYCFRSEISNYNRCSNIREGFNLMGEFEPTLFYLENCVNKDGLGSESMNDNF